MGGSVDHEAVSVEDALSRARAGMKVLMRFGSGVADLPNLIGAYTDVGISPRQLALCTDVLLPETLLNGGVDMAFAADEPRRMGGGQIVVCDGKVLAAFRMPILGLFSDQPYEDVMVRRREIQAAAESLGCTLQDPLLKLEFSYACAEFPLLRMSEEGLFRTDTKKHLAVTA